MTVAGPNLVLVALIGVLFATGVYLLLERSLSRVLVGVALLGNGVNLLILNAGGAAGGPPIIGTGPEEEMADPLPQALILTAIVITLGLTAFLLAMAYRSWQLVGHDEVQDDAEDRRLVRRALRGVVQRTDFSDVGTSLAQDAAEARDETAHALTAVDAPRAAAPMVEQPVSGSPDPDLAEDRDLAVDDDGARGGTP